MDKNDFTKAAKALGYSDDEIQEWIDLYEDAEKTGVTLDWNDFLIEEPID